MGFWDGAAAGIASGGLGTLGGLASSALGAYYAGKAAEDNYYYASQLAEQQYGYNSLLMDKANAFSKSMYDTNMDYKYQRTVADMKKAGLNPLLAAGGSLSGGSSVPSSAMASAGLPQMSVHSPQVADMSSIGSQAVSAYLAAKSLDTELQQKQAQTTKTKVDTYVDAVKGATAAIGGTVGAVTAAKYGKRLADRVLNSNGVASPVGSSFGGSILGSKFLGALGLGAQAATAYGAYKLNEHLRKVSPSARKIQDMPNFGSRLR